jgi:hypothetical protein
LDAQVEVLFFLREAIGRTEHGGEEKGEEEESRAMKHLVRQRDVDGNTALHFLAGHRTVKMRDVAGCGRRWRRRRRRKRYYN